VSGCNKLAAAKIKTIARYTTTVLSYIHNVNTTKYILIIHFSVTYCFYEQEVRVTLNFRPGMLCHENSVELSFLFLLPLLSPASHSSTTHSLTHSLTHTAISTHGNVPQAADGGGGFPLRGVLRAAVDGLRVGHRTHGLVPLRVLHGGGHIR
jgi:hypothetical protein